LDWKGPGMECKWQVELLESSRKVLKKHWPDIPQHEDVRDCHGVGYTVDSDTPQELESVDLICGGFPCQDVSLAGKRAGLHGKRSTLWAEMYRIAIETNARWIVAENVPGLLSSDNGRFFGNVLRDLAEGGYNAEWECIPAFAFGSPQRRERVVLVAYSNGLSDVCDMEQRRTVISGEKVEKKRSCHRPRLVSEIGDVAPSEWAPTTGRFSTIPRPLLLRGDNGVRAGMERNKQLGNAVVPQFAQWIGEKIMAYEENLTA